MIRYKIIAENLYSSELGEYTSYGICVFSEGSKEALIKIPDIFLEKEKAEKLADLCNNYLLDPIHLYDVIEDML